MYVGMCTFFTPDAVFVQAQWNHTGRVQSVSASLAASAAYFPWDPVQNRPHPPHRPRKEMRPAENTLRITVAQQKVSHF